MRSKRGHFATILMYSIQEFKILQLGFKHPKNTDQIYWSNERL